MGTVRDGKGLNPVKVSESEFGAMSVRDPSLKESSGAVEKVVFALVKVTCGWTFFPVTARRALRSVA